MAKEMIEEWVYRVFPNKSTKKKAVDSRKKQRRRTKGKIQEQNKNIEKKTNETNWRIR